MMIMTRPITFVGSGQAPNVGEIKVGWVKDDGSPLVLREYKKLINIF